MVFSAQFDGRTANGFTPAETENSKLSMFHRPNKVFSSRVDMHSAAYADTSSVKSNQAALAAKERFRNQYHHQKAPPRQDRNHNTDHKNDGDSKSAERIAHAVGFKLSGELCPKCSIPMLHQDLATIKEGGKRLVLCHSSSSTTTARTLGNDADTVGASMETYTQHDLNITALHPHGERSQESRRTPSFRSIGSNCGLMLPVLSVLEQFAGTYCDSICADQATTSRCNGGFEQGIANNHHGVRQVPPYCPKCKAYVVQETGNKDLQDEMLTNLASWLASSSSSSSSYEDGESDDGGKVSKVSFRPSHGSITIMPNNRENQQLPRSVNAALSTNKPLSSLKIHPLHPKSPPRSPTSRMDLLPRHSVPSSPGVQKRYVVEYEELQERKSLSSTSSIGRSPRRRRQYLDILDDRSKEKVSKTADVHVLHSTPPVDPRPLILPRGPVAQPVRGSQNDEAYEASMSAELPRALDQAQWHDISHRRGTDERIKKVSPATVPEFLANQSEKVEIKGGASFKEMEASVAHTSPRTKLTTTQGLQQPVVDDDNVSVGSCYTLKEEASIIRDYEKK